MSKMQTLQAGLNIVAGGKTVANAPKVVKAQIEEETPSKANSRDGKVHLGAWLPSAFKSSLLMVRAQTGEDAQTLIGRALNDLFKAHNVPVVDLD